MKKDKVKRNIIGVFAGILAGFFGSGGGVVVVEGLQRSGVEEKQSHAMSLAVIFPIAIVSAFLYHSGGYVELGKTLWVCGGAVAGGIVGALFLKNIKTKWLNRLFTLLMLASGIWMLL